MCNEMGYSTIFKTEIVWHFRHFACMLQIPLGLQDNETNIVPVRGGAGMAGGGGEWVSLIVCLLSKFAKACNFSQKKTHNTIDTLICCIVEDKKLKDEVNFLLINATLSGILEGTPTFNCN